MVDMGSLGVENFCVVSYSAEEYKAAGSSLLRIIGKTSNQTQGNIVQFGRTQY